MSENSKPLWFLDSLAYIRVAAKDGTDGVSVIEILAPRGSSPPLHVHLEEDEIFHILEGELRILVDGKETTLRRDGTALGPQGKPHTLRVESETAHYLVVTRKGLFEGFLRAVSRPAENDTLPPRSGPPTPEQIEALTKAAKEYKIEIIGSPLS